MNDLNTSDETSETPAATPPAVPTPPAPRYWYEVVIDGPVTVGPVQAVRGGRLQLTKERAAALNDLFPGAVKPVGI
jgi:hypothetical protein